MKLRSLRLGPRLSRLAASFVSPAPCALCGRGHAQTGWLLDPMGGMHGRCPGCIDDVSAGATLPKSRIPPTI